MHKNKTWFVITATAEADLDTKQPKKFSHIISTLDFDSAIVKLKRWKRSIKINKEDK